MVARRYCDVAVANLRSHTLWLPLAGSALLLLALSLDQAGRWQHVAGPAGGRSPLGTDCRVRIDVPAGSYDLAARVDLFHDLAAIVVEGPGWSLSTSGARVAVMPATVDIPLGRVAIERPGVEVRVRTSQARGTLHGLVLERAQVGARADLLQRIAAVAGVVAFVLPLGRRAARWAALLSVLPVLFLARVVCFGLVPYGGDTRIQIYPWYELLRRELAHGRVPLWNPYTYLGLPHEANPVTQVLYPPVTLCALAGLPFAASQGFLWIVHVALSGLSTVALARRLRASRTGAFASGLFFMTCPSMQNPEQLPVVAATALIPALLWASLPPRRPFVLAVLAALLFLAGHLQFLAYGLLALVIVAALNPEATPRARRIATLGLGLGLGSVLACAVAVPFLEYASLSERGRGLTVSHAATGAVRLPRALQSLDLGLEHRLPARPPTMRACTAVVSGVIALPLVAAAVADLGRRRRRGRVASLCTIAVVGAAISMGDVGRFSPFLLLSRTPFFAGQRQPNRAMLLVALAVALLAGLGLDRLRAAARRPLLWRAPTALALAMLGSGWALAFLAGELSWRRARDGAVIAGFLLSLPFLGRLVRRSAGIAGLLLLLAAVDRFDDCFTIRGGALPAAYRTGESVSRPPAHGLREILTYARNDAILSRRLSAWGYDPLIPRVTAEIWNQVQPGIFGFDEGGQLDTFMPALAPGALVTPAAIDALERMGVSRLHLGATPVPVALDDRIVPLGASRARGEYLLPRARRAWLEPDLGVVPAVSDVSPHEVAVAFPAPLARSCRLVLADTYFPGWQATVNGAPRRILARSGRRALDLDRGSLRVTMRYVPFAYRIGLFVSCGGALTLAVMAAAGSQRRSHIRNGGITAFSPTAGGRNGTSVAPRQA